MLSFQKIKSSNPKVCCSFYVAVVSIFYIAKHELNFGSYLNFKSILIPSVFIIFSAFRQDQGTLCRTAIKDHPSRTISASPSSERHPIADFGHHLLFNRTSIQVNCSSAVIGPETAGCKSAITACNAQNPELCVI